MCLQVGFKPAGGIKTSVEALQWLVLVKEELGNRWLNKNLFRIGASSLLDDIVKAIKWWFPEVSRHSAASIRYQFTFIINNVLFYGE